jgi:ATP-binding cassette subfamily B protein
VTAEEQQKMQEQRAAAPSQPDRPSFGNRMRRLFVKGEGREIVLPAPPVPVKEIFKSFWPYARPYRKWILASIVLIVIVPALQGARLYMIKVTVDEVLVPQDLGPFVWIVPTVIGLTILAGALSFFDSFLTSWVGQRFLLSLRTDFFRHLQRLSLDFFERRRLGDVISRLTEDVNAIESFVLSGVATTLSSLVRIVFFAGFLFYLDPVLALVALLAAPLFAITVKVLSRLIKQATRERRRRAGSTTAIAEESLSNIALVQAYNRQELEVDRFHRQNLGAFDASMVATRLRALFPPIIDLIQGASALIVIGFGTAALQDGDLSLGGLLLFIAYLNQLYAPMRGIASLYNLIYAASAGAERVIEFFRHEPSIVDAPDAPELDRVSGRVEFDSVRFKYPGTDRYAVDDISFKVDPGQTLALVGHSGAGKSTLAKLLLRFYDPTDGVIRIDGSDLQDVKLSSVRENVSVLLQETLIFDGTIRENILYGRPSATEQELIAAAKAADAHEFIVDLDEGYETVVGQKGRRLSGGQRQRVAIARAMIRDAPILILDEPTTGLDAESGHRILEPLRRLMKDRATIVISHNLMTVREAEQIVVLDNGHVVEHGTHDELFKLGGVYSRLCELQERGATPHLRAAADG